MCKHVYVHPLYLRVCIPPSLRPDHTSSHKIDTDEMNLPGEIHTHTLRLRLDSAHETHEMIKKGTKKKKKMNRRQKKTHTIIASTQLQIENGLAQRSVLLIQSLQALHRQKAARLPHMPSTHTLSLALRVHG